MIEHTHHLTWVDYSIIGLILLSMLMGLFRGFVREMISLVTWLLAFLVAILFSDKVSHLFSGHIDSPQVCIGLSFILLLIIVLIIGLTINNLLSGLVAKSSLSGLNRMIGLFFGLLRGIVIVVGVLLFLKLTYVVHTSAWHHSVLLPYLQSLVDVSSSLLPADISVYFKEIH